jgi:hypothetical protein
MKLTPPQYLYLKRRYGYIQRYGKNPSDKEEENMILQAIYDYDHASIHDKMIIDTEYESFIEMNRDIENHIQDRKKISSKPKNIRKYRK